MKKLLTLFFVILISQLQSQASLDDIKFNVFQDLNSSANQNYIRLMNESATEDAVQGLFEFDDWQEASVDSKEGEPLKLDSLNYHIEDENMFFMHEGQLYFLFPSKVVSVYCDGRTFVPIKSSKKTGGHDLYSYYEVLVEGSIHLLKKTTAEKHKVNNHPMGISHGVETYDYRVRTAYFYSESGLDDINDLPKSKRNIIKVFKRNRNRMVEYARENNISHKSETDLVNMFNYYNSIKQ